MDGGGFDGRGARHFFCRSLGPIGQGSSKSRAPERFVRGITNLRADFHGSALFFASAQVIFGSRIFPSTRSVNFRQPSGRRPTDRRLRKGLNTTSLRAFYIFFMPRLLEWRKVAFERTRVANIGGGFEDSTIDQNSAAHFAIAFVWQEAGPCGISAVSWQAYCFFASRLDTPQDATG
jgi:hypothetical protein